LAVNNAALATSPLESIVAVVLGGGLLVFVGGLIAVAYVYGFIGYNIIDPILGLLGSPTALSTTPISSAKVEEIAPALSEAPVQKKTRPVTTSLKKAVDSVRDSLGARAVINSALGRQNADDKTGNAVGASAAGENESDLGGAKPIRRTPVRDAIATVRSDLPRVVSQVRDGVERTLGGAQRSSTTNDADSQGPSEAT
jgi:predicted lipid-binding transport protein (Tim44 family)